MYQNNSGLSPTIPAGGRVWGPPTAACAAARAAAAEWPPHSHHQPHGQGADGAVGGSEHAGRRYWATQGGNNLRRQRVLHSLSASGHSSVCISYHVLTVAVAWRAVHACSGCQTRDASADRHIAQAALNLDEVLRDVLAWDMYAVLAAEASSSWGRPAAEAPCSYDSIVSYVKVSSQTAACQQLAKHVNQLYDLTSGMRHSRRSAESASCSNLRRRGML